MDRKAERGLSAFALHLIAMALMLCDHLWATVIPGNQWMNCVGRLAFPIFSFLLAQGFFRTHSRKKYALRLLIFALLSEIPFDLIYEGALFDPFHQNVLWTLLLGFLCMCGIERVKAAGRLWLTLTLGLVFAALGWLCGTVLCVDYGGAGVLTILLFYAVPGRKWWQMLLQLAGMLWIHCSLIKGMFFTLTLSGCCFEWPLQGFAVFSLLLIWLYRGRHGPHSKVFQFACYAFYPAHMLLLALLGR